MVRGVVRSNSRRVRSRMKPSFLGRASADTPFDANACGEFPWSDCGGSRIRSEADDCRCFGVVDVEYGQKPGQLKHVVKLIAQIGQVQCCALILGTDVGSYQNAESCAVVALSGRIVLGEESNLLREKVKSLTAEGKKKIVLNMADVTYIDSAGLGIYFFIGYDHWFSPLP